MIRFASVSAAALLLATACAPASEDAGTTATAAVDTAAVSSGMAALRSQYIALETAGDATGLAGLYAPEGGIDFYGAPRVRGRAAIEAFFNTDFAARKYTLSEITPVSLNPRTSSVASELGTYHNLHDAMGTKDHEWGRYLVAVTKDSTGQWHIDYLIAFSDSTKVEK